jgi:hypothetical protein
MKASQDRQVFVFFDDKHEHMGEALHQDAASPE